ncbi:Two-component transcriptional response regulator, LuxR family [hydrothermal vent metagenome]|uniref:Two-component transcriptional response regulator, LuxR family n=1 Tax=hydrothermal vent metagenome TaxID=652676 RepID=A0A3B1B350_9ZZZZ
MSKKIAIVEDEPAIRENYADVLRRQGYEVNGYATRQEALTAFQRQLPNLAILDIGLPDDPDGGFELCRELRALSPGVPIIFLTARDGDIDTVTGLRLGADDYLTKDISLPHLTARIAALFRRIEALRQPPVQEQLLERPPLSIDLDRLTVTWDSVAVDLTITELWIITALARRPGHVKTRDQLMEEANIVVDATTISTHIKRIRRKFNAVAPEFNAIEAVYGIGYRWNTESA